MRCFGFHDRLDMRMRRHSKTAPASDMPLVVLRRVRSSLLDRLPRIAVASMLMLGAVLGDCAAAGLPGAGQPAAGKSGASQPASEPSREWVAAWAIAPQSVARHPQTPVFNRAPSVAGRTVRQIVFPRVAGQRVRIRFSNVYGTQPVHLAVTDIALAANGAALAPETSRAVTFGGKRDATIAPGAVLLSDAVSLDIRAGEPVAISSYIDGGADATTWHKIGSQINYVSTPGDYTAIAGADVFRQRVTSYLWLDGLLVASPPQAPAYTVVAIGDSITDGMRSSLNANRRWPDWLARRLTQQGDARVSVVNLGISGNRLLNDSACYGEKLAARFNRDALEQPGVRAAIILIGINDINFGAMPARAGLDCDFPHAVVTAAQLIDGYTRLAAQAHGRGVRVYIATLTPADLPPARESVRAAVNQWIRSQKVFDGVVDFDAAVRDPAHPTRMLARYDSGDHVHPSDAGYEAMAANVPLQWFVASR
jgi:lysophospholipase L1-like esterase